MNSFNFADSHISRTPLLDDLGPIGCLHLPLFVSQGRDEDLVFVGLFLSLVYFVFRYDQPPLSLTLLILQLVDVGFKLRDHVTHLLVLELKLLFNGLLLHIAQVLTVKLDLLDLRCIISTVTCDFGRLQLNFKTADLMLRLSVLSFLDAIEMARGVGMLKWPEFM